MLCATVGIRHGHYCLNVSCGGAHALHAQRGKIWEKSAPRKLKTFRHWGSKTLLLLTLLIKITGKT